MAYTIKDERTLELIDFLIQLGILPDFDQYIKTKSNFLRVTFRDDKIREWSTPVLTL